MTSPMKFIVCVCGVGLYKVACDAKYMYRLNCRSVLPGVSYLLVNVITVCSFVSPRKLKFELVECFSMQIYCRVLYSFMLF
jgi:hypothetical protein